MRRGLQIHRERHDTGDDGELGGLKAHDFEIEPAFRTIPLFTNHHGRHEPEDAEHVDGNRSETNPPIIDERRNEENRQTDAYPDELGRPVGLIAHPGGTIDRVHSIGEQDHHEQHDEPVHTQNLSEKRMHRNGKSLRQLWHGGQQGFRVFVLGA